MLGITLRQYEHKYTIKPVIQAGSVIQAVGSNSLVIIQAWSPLQVLSTSGTALGAVSDVMSSKSVVRTVLDTTEVGHGVYCLDKVICKHVF